LGGAFSHGNSMGGGAKDFIVEKGGVTKVVRRMKT